MNDSQVLERFQEGVPTPREFAAMAGFFAPSESEIVLSEDLQMVLEGKLDVLRRFTSSRALFKNLFQLQAQTGSNGNTVGPLSNFLEDWKRVDNFSKAFQNWLVLFLNDLYISLEGSKDRQYAFMNFSFKIIDDLLRGYEENSRGFFKLIRMISLEMKNCTSEELNDWVQALIYQSTNEWAAQWRDIFNKIFKKENAHIFGSATHMETAGLLGALVRIEATQNDFEDISAELALSIFGEI